MFKKALTILVAVCMIAAFAVTASADEGNEVIILAPGEYGGAHIDGSILTAGESYTLDIKVKLGQNSNGGLRVRYNKDGPAGSSDASMGDSGGDAANANPANASFVSAGLPAHIANDDANLNKTIDFTVNFVYGAGVENAGNDKWITVFGYWGASDFEVLGVTVKNAAGSVIAAAGEATAIVPISASVETVQVNETASAVVVNTADGSKGDVKTGAAGVATVAGIAIIATAGVLVSVKKRK